MQENLCKRNESISDNLLPVIYVNRGYPKNQCLKNSYDWKKSEYDSWVRSFHSSLRRIITVTWRREAVIIVRKRRKLGMKISMTEMQPTTEILTRISKNSLNNKNETFTRLFRYMQRQDIWLETYNNLYANNGATTKGINNDTADGFSKIKVQKIIEQLKNGSYVPKPVRRIYIEKKNSAKMRPLGIPSFTDKLVQEVIRMILEAIYEPIFLECSHGFRPHRSCHTALKSLSKKFTGAKWFVEGDIKGCFNNIDHKVMIAILNKKIKDARLLQLIQRFLKAGYMENWVYHKTYSGTPQGGIISPIIANIYLHELDKFVESLKENFDKPSTKKYTMEYQKAKYQTEKARKAIRDCNPENREQKNS